MVVVVGGGDSQYQQQRQQQYHGQQQQGYKDSTDNSSSGSSNRGIGPAGTERKFLEANTNLPGGKISVSTFWNDLETQEMEFVKYAGVRTGQRVRLVQLLK